MSTCGIIFFEGYVQGIVDSLDHVHLFDFACFCFFKKFPKIRLNFLIFISIITCSGSPRVGVICKMSMMPTLIENTRVDTLFAQKSCQRLGKYHGRLSTVWLQFFFFFTFIWTIKKNRGAYYHRSLAFLRA